MPDKAYLSNLNAMWPIERQEALLAAKVPDWQSVARYQDILKPRHRKSHQSSLLVQRTAMLRPTGRRGAERIYLASMAVFAWDGADLELALSGAWVRGATLVVVDRSLEIAPYDNEAAREVFKRSRKRASVEARSKAGAIVSAAVRRKRADEGIERIRERWGMPSDVWATATLLAEAGEPGNPLAYNTVTAPRRLPLRETAQRIYKAKLKRAARRSQQAEAQT